MSAFGRRLHNVSVYGIDSDQPLKDELGAPKVRASVKIDFRWKREPKNRAEAARKRRMEANARAIEKRLAKLVATEYFR